MNKNKYLLSCFLAIIVAVGAWYFLVNAKGTVDYLDATYRIDGLDITLSKGKSEMAAAPGSSSKLITQYFGNVAKGDLNEDGIPDLAFLLTQNAGGSGTFYYVVAALQNKDGGYTGTDAVFLGDRIAPQSTEIRGGQIIVNFADRKPSEPMTAQPSVGVSKYLKVSGGKLLEVAPVVQ